MSGLHTQDASRVQRRHCSEDSSGQVIKESEEFIKEQAFQVEEMK